MISASFLNGVVFGLFAAAIFFLPLCSGYERMVERQRGLVHRMMLVNRALRLVIEGRASKIEESVDAE